MRLTDEQRLKVEYNVGKADGIREVVEWVNSHISFVPEQDIARVFNPWKAKLEEWGVINEANRRQRLKVEYNKGFYDGGKEMAEEIFEELIKRWACIRPDDVCAIYFKRDDWQAFKDKYLGGK